MKKRMFLFVRLAIGIGIILSVFTSASGQAPAEVSSQPVLVGDTGLGPEYQISTAVYPDLDRYKPAVAYNSQRNEFLVVWHYHDASHYWIEGRIVKSTGEPVSVVGKILQADTVGVYQAAVAYNATNNQYLIVWMKNSNGDGKTYDIWGNIFSADLVAQMTAFQIASYQNVTFWTPRVAWNSVGNEYMVVWSAFNATTNLPLDISQATILANGDIWGSIILTSADYPHQADVVYNPVRDEYLVVWRRQWTVADWDIVGARVASGPGTVVTPPGVFVISQYNEDERSPRVATNGYDRYFVVWEKAAPGACCDWDIYGREVNFDGVNLGLVHAIAGWGSIDETNPFVVAWPGNRREFLVGYERENTSWTDTYAAFYDNGRGAIVAGDMNIWLDYFSVANYAFWNSNVPAGAVGKNKVMIAYQGDSVGDPTVIQHIYGRAFTPYPVFIPNLRK